MHAVKSSYFNDLQGGVRLVTGSVVRAPLQAQISGEIEGNFSRCPTKFRAISVAHATADVQYAHLRAPTGISLRHSGHCFLSGGAAGSFLCMRDMSAFTGSTTK